MAVYVGNDSYTIETKLSGFYGSRAFEVDRYLYDNSNSNLLEVNPYTAFYESREQPDAVHPFWGPVLITAPFANPLVDYPADAEAVAELFEEWTQTSFNMGVALAEGKESAAMIANRLISIGKAARALKRGSVGGAMRHFSNVPKGARRRAAAKVKDSAFDAWLELRYGWVPLFGDIYEASQLLKPKPVYTNLRASKRNTGVSSSTYEYNRLVGDVTVNRHQEKGVSAYCKVSRTPSWAERLGLTDPLSIAWELVPWSFVADWFLPIGATIQANYVRSFMPIVSSGISRRTKEVSTLTPLDPELSVTGQCYRRTTKLTRSAGLGSAASDLAQLGQKTQPKWDTTLKRMVDSVAFANNAVRRLR